MTVSLAAHATTLTVHTNIGVTVSLAALVKALTVRTSHKRGGRERDQGLPRATMLYEGQG